MFDQPNRAQRDAQWHIQLLGDFVLSRSAQRIDRFRTRKTGALLAYLAYYIDQTQTRERLVDLFWPNADEGAGRDSLSTALVSLRRQLEPPAIPRGSVLIADRHTVRLNPEAVQTDVARFEKLMAQATGRRSFPEQLRYLSGAFDLYRGTLLPNLADDWIQPQRQRLREQYIIVSGRLLALLYEDTRFNEAITVAQRAVQLEPEQEATHYHLLDALLRAGDIALFTEHYNAYRGELQVTLGLDPSDRILALQQTAEHEQPPQSVVIPPQPSMQNSGTGLHLLVLTEIPDHHLMHDASATMWRQTDTTHGIAFNQAKACIAWLVAYFGAGKAAMHVGEQTSDGFDLRATHQLDVLLASAHSGQIICTSAVFQVLRGADEADVLRFLHLGSYRLEERQYFETIYQIEAVDHSIEPFPPLKLLPGLRNNLPLYMTRYFGQTALMTDVCDELRTGKYRLLTVTGMGGIGKTRFAVEVARQFVDTDSVIFVPMADVDYVEFIPDMILEQLPNVDITRAGSHEAIVEILDQHRVLLVLDRFEHLVDGGNLYLERLLAQASRVRLIVTSQRRLGIPGEREISLAPLETMGANDTLAALMQMPSVALFVDRARLTRPDFQLTETNANDVVALCQQLEGIPLAIELAAARSQIFTPAQMIAQLAERFAFLVDRARRPNDPHRALYSTITWSYDLLDAAQQQGFAQLSVFRASWSLDAARVICDLSDAADVLEDLVNHSLVRTFESGGEMRFQMYDTIRAFAAEQLPTEQQAALADNHTRYFRQLALALQSDNDRLETEMDNFRAVMWRTLETDIDSYLDVASALLPLWQGQTAYLREGRHWLEQGLRYVEGTGTPTVAEIRKRAEVALDSLVQVQSIRRNGV